MKFSSKALYGGQALFDLAFHADGAGQIKEICERQSIPPRFLEQVFQDLRRAGLVTSKRGPRGGYQLALPPAHIRLGDIVRALEGPVHVSPVARDSTIGATFGYRVAQETLNAVSIQIQSSLDGVTIADMCQQAEAMGIAPRATPAYVYAI